MKLEDFEKQTKTAVSGGLQAHVAWFLTSRSTYFTNIHDVSACADWCTTWLALSNNELKTGG